MAWRRGDIDYRSRLGAYVHDALRQLLLPSAPTDNARLHPVYLSQMPLLWRFCQRIAANGIRWSNNACKSMGLLSEYGFPIRKGRATRRGQSGNAGGEIRSGRNQAVATLRGAEATAARRAIISLRRAPRAQGIWVVQASASLIMAVIQRVLIWGSVFVIFLTFEIVRVSVRVGIKMMIVRGMSWAGQKQFQNFLPSWKQ
jgi:hypothetical protein